MISFFDQKGIHRLQIVRGKTAQSIHSFPSMKAAYQWLNVLKDEHNIQGRWIGLHHFQGQELQEEIEVHNQALLKALDSMLAKQPSYLVIGRGRKEHEKSLVWVQQGNLKGYAFIDRDQRIDNEDELDWIIEPLPSSEITPYLLRSHYESPKQCYIKNFSDPVAESDKW